MTSNITKIRTHIQDFRFEDLFIEELGWDQYRNPLEVVVDGDYVTLTAFAEKRGMVAFTVGDIPEYKLRRKVEQQVAKVHRENIIIYTDPQRTQQIWQWVRRETGKPLASRERPFYAGQSGEHIAQILSGIAFSLDEEDDLTIVDVTSRVRASFDVERVTKRFYDRFKKLNEALRAASSDLGGSRRATQVAVDRRFGDPIRLHQIADQLTVLAALTQFFHLLVRELTLGTKLHAACFGFLDAIHLPFGPDLRLELGNGSEHVEQQSSGGVTGIDILVNHLKMHALAVQFIGDLAQVQRGTRQPIQARDDQ